MKTPSLVLLLALFLPSGLADAEEASGTFVGRIVYAQTAAGEGEGAKAFRGLAASEVVVHIGRAAYRQDENGGLNEGSVIVWSVSTAALRLDHKKRRSELGRARDLEKTEEKVKAFLVWQFKTDLEETEETGTICGFPVRRYRVKKSGFVRQGASAHVWITRELMLPRRRFRFDFQWHSPTSPLPLSIPLEAGAILKAEVVEAGTTVTFTATQVKPGEPAATLFRKPQGYEGPDLQPDVAPQPAPDKATAAPPTLSAADIAKLPRTRTNTVGMKLALILPGTFQMGSPADEPHRHANEVQHEVTLTRPYYMATCEVTQAQWRAVMGRESPSHFKGDDLPVESVTWEEARAFCAKLAETEGKRYRLPTEAEWEYAARAGERVDYKRHKAHKAWLMAHAWQSFNAGYKTHAVGLLKPNAWGLFDTIGNVEEWTADGFGPYAKGPVVDPRHAASDRIVTRGNGWVSGYDFCRVAARDVQPPAKSKATIGFRVVYTP